MLKQMLTADGDMQRFLIRAYQYVIDRFDICGFRIDTLRYLKGGLAQTFGNAILEFALNTGKKNVFPFGEVLDNQAEEDIARFIGRDAEANYQILDSNKTTPTAPGTVRQTGRVTVHEVDGSIGHGPWHVLRVTLPPMEVQILGRCVFIHPPVAGICFSHTPQKQGDFQVSAPRAGVPGRLRHFLRREWSELTGRMKHRRERRARSYLGKLIFDRSRNR